MKSLTFLRLVGVLTILISLAGITLYGQGQQPSSQDPAAQSQPSDMPSSQSQPTQIFVGKITKSKGEIVFMDAAGAMYKLDNADQAKSWVGKAVKITGTLDDATKTIHVTNLEPPSS
jgi:hypothetical protein